MNSKNNSSEQWYKFEPMSSINAYELASIVKMLYQIKLNQDVFKNLPKEVKHHFQKITETEAKEN